MAYKGENQVSELLCPITYSWIDLTNSLKDNMN